MTPADEDPLAHIEAALNKAKQCSESDNPQLYLSGLKQILEHMGTETRHLDERMFHLAHQCLDRAQEQWELYQNIDSRSDSEESKEDTADDKRQTEPPPLNSSATVEQNVNIAVPDALFLIPSSYLPEKLRQVQALLAQARSQYEFCVAQQQNQQSNISQGFLRDMRRAWESIQVYTKEVESLAQKLQVLSPTDSHKAAYENYLTNVKILFALNGKLFDKAWNDLQSKEFPSSQSFLDWTPQDLAHQLTFIQVRLFQHLDFDVDTISLLLICDKPLTITSEQDFYQRQLLDWHAFMQRVIMVQLLSEAAKSRLLPLVKHLLSVLRYLHDKSRNFYAACAIVSVLANPNVEKFVRKQVWSKLEPKEREQWDWWTGLMDTKNNFESYYQLLKHMMETLRASFIARRPLNSAPALLAIPWLEPFRSELFPGQPLLPDVLCFRPTPGDVVTSLPTFEEGILDLNALTSINDDFEHWLLTQFRLNTEKMVFDDTQRVLTEANEAKKQKLLQEHEKRDPTDSDDLYQLAHESLDDIYDHFD